MKKVKFWMDFDEQCVIGKKELEEWHAKRVKVELEDYYAWEDWLNNNYGVLEMFNASEQEKKDIRAEYEELVKKDLWNDILDDLSEVEVDFEDLTIVEG